MRTFSCLLFDSRPAAPMFVLASDALRARALAHRDLVSVTPARWPEIRETRPPPGDHRAQA
ncbi:MAG TPA: hypothetical protein VFH92_07790 [Phenylobacterium sp.]|nr:hypothetical protein [Phenylobacterium sp.]